MTDSGHGRLWEISVVPAPVALNFTYMMWDNLQTNPEMHLDAIAIYHLINSPRRDNRAFLGHETDKLPGMKDKSHNCMTEPKGDYCEEQSTMVRWWWQWWWWHSASTLKDKCSSMVEKGGQVNSSNYLLLSVQRVGWFYRDLLHWPHVAEERSDTLNK